MDEEKEKCFLTGVEVANLTHEALDDIFLNRRLEATEKLNRAEILADRSECVSVGLKERIRGVAEALRSEVAKGRI